MNRFIPGAFSETGLLFSRPLMHDAGKLGSISSVQPEASVHPELVAVTSTGRISVVAQLDETTSLRLTELQRNLGYILKGPGGAELST